MGDLPAHRLVPITESYVDLLTVCGSCLAQDMVFEIFPTNSRARVKLDTSNMPTSKVNNQSLQQARDSVSLADFDRKADSWQGI